jgi:replicative DNA helicase
VPEDLGAERAVLAGTIHSGENYLDISYFIRSSTFTDDVNQILWATIKSLRDEDFNVVIDFPLLVSRMNQLGFDHVIANPNEMEYIKKVLSFSVEPTNVRRLAGAIRKLEIARLLDNQLEEIQERVREIKGNETTDYIISLAENKIIDFTDLLIGKDEQGIIHVSDGADDYFKYICDPENERDVIGIPTGYPIFDSIIEGLQRKTVNTIAARAGVGKSMLADNIAIHVTGTVQVPVLYMDTEMDIKGHWHRMWANLSGVPSRDIGKGHFARNELHRRNVENAVNKLNKWPYFYVNISGKSFEEILAYMRRWIRREVGQDENGNTKDCVIIYDYLKMTDSQGLSSEMKEWQIMGFRMTSLHNFAVRFDVPILTFVQLNRDGIEKESADVISQSDRIVWLTSSLSIYKPKSVTEMAETSEYGNRKLIILKNRYGPQTEHEDYINMISQPHIASIKEGRLASSVPRREPETCENEPKPKQKRKIRSM